MYKGVVMIKKIIFSAGITLSIPVVIVVYVALLVVLTLLDFIKNFKDIFNIFKEWVDELKKDWKRL